MKKHIGLLPAILTMIAIILITSGVMDWKSITGGLANWTVWGYWIIGLILLTISYSFGWEK